MLSYSDNKYYNIEIEINHNHPFSLLNRKVISALNLNSIVVLIIFYYIYNTFYQ